MQFKAFLKQILFFSFYRKMSILCKVFCATGVDWDEKLSTSLKACKIESFVAICSLTDNDFLKECEQFCQGTIDPSFCFTPGDKAVLRHIGREITKMGKKKFTDLIINDQSLMKETAEIPRLLKVLNEQIGQRNYSSEVKDISTLFRLLGGPQLYEIIQKCLGLPSTSSTNKYITNQNPFREGELQVRFSI